MKINLKRATMAGMATTLAVGLVALGVLAAGSIVAWEYSNSNQFCATMCHSVHPEESRSHTTSPHARVNCVECHMGRLSTLHMLALKPTHFKELWGMIAGYDRPLTSHTLRPSRDHCESCHWPQAEHHDSVAIKKRYATDEESSETSYRLTLHTGVGVVREKEAKGVHWHIQNEVSFISVDPQSRTIPWVQVKHADGTTSTYTDVSSKVPPEEMKKHAVKRMECYDCHSGIGHPFSNPEDLVDQAIAEGRIDRALPSAKARAVALIEKTSNLIGPKKDLEPKIEKLIAESAPKGEQTDESRALEKKFADEMKRILVTSSFSHEGLSWKSFPDHSGHKDFAGCFRCHNGKHLNEKGESIRLQCTLCHDLPQVTRENGEGSVPSLVKGKEGNAAPSSHSKPNFMHDHQHEVTKRCESCHGDMEHGTDGGKFCSNPACHGRKWPEVNLTVVKKPGS
jgi:nitrate/TMAO reductase-like tetraheme cytochrome c subunit